MIADSLEQTTIEEQPVEQIVATPEPWLTVERALYGVVLIIAIFVRFFALGDQPLSPLEAANAWPAWLAATATNAPAPPTPTSALLYSIHTVLFFGSPAVATPVPAPCPHWPGLLWCCWPGGCVPGWGAPGRCWPPA
jgi:hypothetical protein